MVYQASEDTTDEKYVVTTIKRLVKGKWHTAVVKEKIKN
jgi:hypothetical protein